MRIPTVSVGVRATPITPDNRSTAVTIATWLLLIILIIMFLSREAIKFVVLRKFQIDDLLILLATLFAVGLSVTTLVLASNGLGVLRPLTVRRADVFMKLYYASDFLYISSLCFAKLSLVSFFYGVGVKKVHRRIVQGLGVFIITWTIASLVAVAFQCGLPRPWEMLTLRCYNSGVFWIVYCIIDMTTDVSIIMLSVNLVAYLQVNLSRKITVVACFAPRVLVIVAALARLIYLYPINPHMKPAFNLWIPVICTQIQVCLSISTACIPYMKPFFEGVEAGVWRADDLRRKGMMVDELYAYRSAGGSLGTKGHGHSKGKEIYSMDSTIRATSYKYGRSTDVSPQIPTPVPLSPLTTPRITTPRTLTPPPPPNSRAASSKSPSERGLKISIPPPESRVMIDVTSPQTASSIALSPHCLSPQPLLSPSPTRPLPQPPTIRSPRPLIPSSYYGTPELSAFSPPRTFSPPVVIPPFPRPPSSQYTTLSPPTMFNIPLPPIPPLKVPRSNSRNMNVRVSLHRMAPKSEQPQREPLDFQREDIDTGNPLPPPPPPPQADQQPVFPPRSSSRKYQHRHPTPRQPKYTYTTTPPLHSNPHPRPPSSTTIPSYYTRTPPQALATSTPPSPHRIRNQRVLSPKNSSRWDQMSPVSPETPSAGVGSSPRTPLGFWREDGGRGMGIGDAGNSGSGLGIDRGDSGGWDDGRPVIRDVRSSPRIVVHRYS